jgi:hypothetical protein
MDMIELVKNTFEIGEKVTVKNSPFTQIPKEFAGTITTITDDIFVVTDSNGAMIKISAWDLGLALHHGEITIIIHPPTSPAQLTGL